VTRSGRTASAAALVLLTLLITISGVAAQGTVGQGVSRPANRLLELASQTTWVAPEGVFDLHLRVRGATDDTRLVVRVFGPVSGRGRFDQSVQGENLGTPLRTFSEPLASLPRDVDGAVAVSLPVSATTTPANGLLLNSPGVFPVSVALADASGAELDRFVTHLVRVPAGDSSGAPLAVSLLVPVEAAPAHQPDGSVQFDDAALRRITTTIGALARSPSVPLAVEATPETIDALATRDQQFSTSFVRSLAGALHGRQLLDRTFVNLDLGAWVTPELNPEFARQLAGGSETLTSLLGTRPDARTWVADPTVTPESISTLRFLGVDQFVIPADQLGAPPADDVTFARTFDILDSTGAPVRSVQTDPTLRGRLTETEDPVLNAQLTLADMAVLAFDRPAQARGIVLALPADTEVPVPTLDALLAGLTARAGEPGTGGRAVVSPVTLDDLFTVTDPVPPPGRPTARGTALVRTYTADGSRPLGSFPTELDATRRKVEAYRSMLDPGDGARATPLDQQVLTSGALELAASSRHDYLVDVDQRVEEQFAGVAVPSGQRVTLTGKSGRIPLSLENTLDYPITIQVVLTSEKLEFPEGNTVPVTIDPLSTTRIEVPVETRASGAFPLDVAVASPDGAATLTSTRFTVRSTAISGIGLVLSIGAGLFLLVWWARHFRSTRRDRRLVSSSHPTLRDPSAA